MSSHSQMLSIIVSVSVGLTLCLFNRVHRHSIANSTDKYCTDCCAVEFLTFFIYTYYDHFLSDVASCKRCSYRLWFESWWLIRWVSVSTAFVSRMIIIVTDHFWSWITRWRDGIYISFLIFLGFWICFFIFFIWTLLTVSNMRQVAMRESLQTQVHT